MRFAPKYRLDPRAKTLWRISGALQSLPVLAIGGFVSYALVVRGEEPLYAGGLPLFGAVLLAVLFIAVLPGVLWRRWRYEIRPLEVDLQRGIFRITRTLVPMARVQHVDTRRGPLQRRFGLSTVVFYTAAGPNEIPQLAAGTASEVRDRISELAQETGGSEI